jgi:hypothetical protein
MKVTENMYTESGLKLLKLSDFLDEEGTGLKLSRTGELVELQAGAGEYPSMTLRFVVSDIWLIMAQLGRLAAEAQDLYPEEIKAGPEDYSWLRIIEDPTGSGDPGYAPARVREQDQRDYPHDEDCPRCGRRQWGGPDPYGTCMACGYVLEER